MLIFFSLNTFSTTAWAFLLLAAGFKKTKAALESVLAAQEATTLLFVLRVLLVEARHNATEERARTVVRRNITKNGAGYSMDRKEQITKI